MCECAPRWEDYFQLEDYYAECHYDPDFGRRPITIECLDTSNTGSYDTFRVTQFLQGCYNENAVSIHDFAADGKNYARFFFFFLRLFSIPLFENCCWLFLFLSRSVFSGSREFLQDISRPISNDN